MATDVSRKFGDVLREYRRAAGLTQEELAERAGISPRSISEMERGGEHVPRRDTVSLLARALGLDGRRARGVRGSWSNDRRKTAAAWRSRPLRADAPSALAGVGGVNDRRPAQPAALADQLRRPRARAGRARRAARASSPLLTLIGAGGVGKTRLAHELVRTRRGDYADGAWVVEVGELADPALLPGADRRGGRTARDADAQPDRASLAAYLERKQLLLVLDNCEHLIDACAELVVQLLRACPNLQVLATSREPLSIPGEVTSVGAAARAAEPATRLFVDRATAANHDLALNEQNAAAVARICLAVDGIPLALELAAARTRMLTVHQIAQRLDHDGALLAASGRSGPPQHRTIRATIDWSHDLLGEQEQVLLRRLAVFAGGWTLEWRSRCAPAGASRRSSVLDLLAQLVDKSMVLVDAGGVSACWSRSVSTRWIAWKPPAKAPSTAVGTWRHVRAGAERAPACAGTRRNPRTGPRRRRARQSAASRCAGP